MQDFRNILASCKNKNENIYSPPCVQLKLLNQTLTKWTSSSVIPFRGLIINPEHEKNENSSVLSECATDIDVNFSQIIKSIPLHRLIVKFSEDNRKIPRSCPVISLLRRWIPFQDEWIEELELINLPSVVCKQLKKMGQLHMLSLKTLSLSFDFLDLSTRCEVLTTFCSNAPKLKKLETAVDHDSLPLIPVSLYKAIKHFNLTEIPGRTVEQCLLALAEQEPSLRQLEMPVIPVSAQFFASYKLVFQRLIKSSQSTLENLNVEIVDEGSFLAVFNDLFSGPVATVNSLTFYFVSLNEIEWLPILDNFDFNLFPGLKNVTILETIAHNTVDVVDNLEPHPSPALSATFLLLDSMLSNVEVAYFQRVFPNISKLHHWGIHWDGSSFAQVWASWPKLEELATNLEGYWNCNFDAEICGIFQEEVDFLRQQSTEYLQAVHIVPVRPALTTMSSKHMLVFEWWGYFFHRSRRD